MYSNLTSCYVYSSPNHGGLFRSANFQNEEQKNGNPRADTYRVGGSAVRTFEEMVKEHNEKKRLFYERMNKKGVSDTSNAKCKF